MGEESEPLICLRSIPERGRTRFGFTWEQSAETLPTGVCVCVSVRQSVVQNWFIASAGVTVAVRHTCNELPQNRPSARSHALGQWWKSQVS